MSKRYKFDYDYDNDSLFIYNPNSKSKSSVEIDNLILDYNSNKEISGVELLNASQFFKEISIEGQPLSKEMLAEVRDCQLEITPKNNFVVLKFLLMFKANKILTAPIMVPTINEPSPALAY